MSFYLLFRNIRYTDNRPFGVQLEFRLYRFPSSLQEKMTYIRP